MTRRYVTRGPKWAPPVLPKDVWHGGIFVEADGTVLEVKYSGRHMPQTDILHREGDARTIGNPMVRIKP